MASVSDINPEKRATNIGAVMTAQGVGAMIGAPIGAAMYEKFQPLGVQLRLGDSFGRYSPFIGCAVCVVAGFLLSLKILHEPKKVEALPTEHDAVAEVVSVTVLPEEEGPVDQPPDSDDGANIPESSPVHIDLLEPEGASVRLEGPNDETHATPKQ